MTTFNTYTQIRPGGALVINDLPFTDGEMVEVLVYKSLNYEMRKKFLYDTLRETQNLPSSKYITEEDIFEEIRLYREGK